MPFSGAGLTASVQATQWLVENQPIKVQVWGRWPWLGVRGSTLTYARVPQLAAALAVNSCAALGANDDTATQIQYGMVEYATRFQYCNADEDIYRDPNRVEQMLTELGRIKLAYGYYGRMDTSVGSPVTGGLPDLCAPGNVLNLGGAALSFPCLEQAFDLVTANSGRPSIIMSSSASMRSYRNLCWAAGIEPPQMPWRWYDPFEGWVSGLVTSFKGVPWLINDMMDQAPTPTNRRIYFMVLGDDSKPTPTRGVTGIRPADLMNNPIIKRSTQGVPQFDGENISVNMTKDVWLTMPAGLALGSQGALSILQNFAHVGSCAVG